MDNKVRQAVDIRTILSPDQPTWDDPLAASRRVFLHWKEAGIHALFGVFAVVKKADKLTESRLNEATNRLMALRRLWEQGENHPRVYDLTDDWKDGFARQYEPAFIIPETFQGDSFIGRTPDFESGEPGSIPGSPSISHQGSLTVEPPTVTRIGGGSNPPPGAKSQVLRSEWYTLGAPPICGRCEQPLYGTLITEVGPGEWHYAHIHPGGPCSTEGTREGVASTPDRATPSPKVTPKPKPGPGPVRYFLDRDGAGDWYAIPTFLFPAWEEWLQEEDPTVDPPSEAIRLPEFPSPSNFTFTDPRVA